jgi:formylglycine-generating enzyme required for sulfatase activity
VNDLACRQLQGLVSTYGPGILQDPRRCRALLLDLCGDHRLEINLVVAALEEGVAARLAAPAPGVPVQVLLAQQVTMLTRVRGLNPQAAQWAVDAIALVAGVQPARPTPSAKIDPPSPSVASPAAAVAPGRPKPTGPRALTLAPGVVLELVRVPAGAFLMGSAASDSEAFGDEKPEHRLILGEYYIGRNPVTVAQWAAFVQATGFRTAAEREGSAWANTGFGWSQVSGADWQHPRGPGSVVGRKSDHPVTQVSWDDAVAFTAWARQVSGRAVRLPTEAEWEKAARGADGRKYPWGNAAPDDSRCNFDDNVEDTTPAGMYSPGGDSPYGLEDVCGNVWEWTSSVFRQYPYGADDRREDPASRDHRVLRGGSFHINARSVRAAGRGNADPTSRRDNYGFRVAASAV